MRYFTPELYRRFNSSDDAVADRAHAEREKANAAYQAQIGALREKMPSSVKRMSLLDLHDAEVIDRFEAWPSAARSSERLSTPRPFVAPPTLETIVLLDELSDISVLFYFLFDRVTYAKPPSDWAFSKSKLYWLYDEIESAGDGSPFFVHHILLSDGAVLRVPFIDAFCPSMSAVEERPKMEHVAS